MSRKTGIKVAVLAGAALMLESAFLRLLAVAQFYHFAFLVVSLALLGFGASGSLLVVSARLNRAPLEKILAWSGGGFVICASLAYLILNGLPFDSYSIAWDSRQIVFFLVYFLALAMPFIASGIGIGASLAAAGDESHIVYAANLLGSAAGAALGTGLLAVAGIHGAILGSCLVTLPTGYFSGPIRRMVLLLGLTGLVILGVQNRLGQAPLGLVISPYKGLSYARQYPGSREIFGGWSAVSRVDIVAGAGTRHMPGLSYNYLGEIPDQVGISLDGNALQPVSLIPPYEFQAHEYLPEYFAFQIAPASDLLVLNPGGGLGVLQGLAGGAVQITAVLGDRLIPKALEATVGEYNPYAAEGVRVVVETPRVTLQRLDSKFDLVFLPLTDAYRPVSSGAFSLTEEYLLTVEGVETMLGALNPGGVLIITRWLQTPPSESIRIVGVVSDALQRLGSENPANQIVAYRGIQTMTILAKPSLWSASELAALRRFLTDRKFDLVWAWDIDPAEVNRFNRLPAPDYYMIVRDMMNAQDRELVFESYPYAIAPPRDDRPFFFHFFTWQQTPDIIRTFGKVWQPFGGSGFLVIFALLALVIFLSTFLIVVPLLLSRQWSDTQKPWGVWAKAFLFFGAIGLAFLLIEIPLIQRWILLLGHPIYAFALVVSLILLFSSLGSRASRIVGVNHRWSLGLLVILGFVTPWLVDWIIKISLGWPWLLRVGVASVSLAPLAVAMGLPFPIGLAWLEEVEPSALPWAWAVNGCASVIAAVIAALLALQYGFSIVLGLGAGLYAVAWLVSLGFAIPRSE